LTTEDFPALFSVSDRAASGAQAVYFRLVLLQLGLNVLASGVVVLPAVLGARVARPASATAAAIVAIWLLLTWMMRAQRFDPVWVDCRAVAESVSTATWRYLMHVPPFDAEGSELEVDRRFIAQLDAIRSARSAIQGHLTASAAGGVEISDQMRQTRRLPLERRRELYIQDRLLAQERWYEDRARASLQAATRWFFVVAAVQLLALGLLVMNVTLGPSQVNAVPLLMTVSTAFVAWTQARRHDELTQSYGAAAQDLRGLASLEPHIQDAAALERFVVQVEDVLSREHTLWCARR